VPDLYELSAPLWLYDGPAAWHFLSVPAETSSEIRAEFRGMSGGFGYLRVEMTIVATVWRTSIFWDGKSATYVLPVKAQVRKAESLRAGDEVRILLRLL